MLVEIAHAHVFSPFDHPFVRGKFSGDDAHESGFPFTVCAYQADMLALEQPEGNVAENGAVAEAVAQVFNIQYTHGSKCLLFLINTIK